MNTVVLAKILAKKTNSLLDKSLAFLTLDCLSQQSGVSSVSIEDTNVMHVACAAHSYGTTRLCHVESCSQRCKYCA